MAESPTKSALAERDRSYSGLASSSASPKRERTTSGDLGHNRERTYSGHATERSDLTQVSNANNVNNIVVRIVLALVINYESMNGGVVA